MTFPRSARRLLMLATTGVLAVGCATKSNTNVGQQAQKNDQPTSQQAQLAGDATGRVRDIISKVGMLQAAAEQLPGTDESENRKLMETCFGDLLQVFPLLEGDYQSGEFRHGMRVLDTSRQQLASGSKDLAIEPTVGQGMRAVARLLTEVNSVVFNNDEQMTKKLDDLRHQVEELDTVHGPLNRVVAARGMRDAASVLQQMSGVLAERTGVEAPKPAAGAQ